MASKIEKSIELDSEEGMADTSLLWLRFGRKWLILSCTTSATCYTLFFEKMGQALPCPEFRRVAAELVMDAIISGNYPAMYHLITVIKSFQLGRLLYRGWLVSFYEFAVLAGDNCLLEELLKEAKAEDFGGSVYGAKAVYIALSRGKAAVFGRLCLLNPQLPWLQFTFEAGHDFVPAEMISQMNPEASSTKLFEAILEICRSGQLMDLCRHYQKLDAKLIFRLWQEGRLVPQLGQEERK